MRVRSSHFRAGRVPDQTETSKVRSGSRLCENSEVQFACRNSALVSLISEISCTDSLGQEKAIENIFLLVLGSRAFSHSLGQNRKYSLRADDVRSTPESGLKSDIAPSPVCARSGHCLLLSELGGLVPARSRARRLLSGWWREPWRSRPQVSAIFASVVHRQSVRSPPWQHWFELIVCTALCLCEAVYRKPKKLTAPPVRPSQRSPRLQIGDVGL